MPVIIRQLDDHGHQHGESFVLVGLEDVEEVVVLEEAHSAVGYLKVNSSDTFNDAFE